MSLFPLSDARKAVEHGYRVFILPNPKGIRTADFIFERKGVYKMFDLKTISGRNFVDNRLKESIGQTNHVVWTLGDEGAVAQAESTSNLRRTYIEPTSAFFVVWRWYGGFLDK